MPFTLPPRPEFYSPNTLTLVREAEPVVFRPKRTLSTLLAKISRRKAHAHAATMAATTSSNSVYKRNCRAKQREKRKEKLRRLRRNLTLVKLKLSWRVEKAGLKMQKMGCLRGHSSLPRKKAAHDTHQLLDVCYSGESTDRCMAGLISLEQARQRNDIVRRPELFEALESLAEREVDRRHRGRLKTGTRKQSIV